MELRRFITEHIDELLVEWESFARTLTPAADFLTQRDLRDHGIQLLYGIARDIAASPDDPDEARTPVACSGVGKAEEVAGKDASRGEPRPSELQLTGAVHGTLRQRDDFTLVQVCAEFRALRESVLGLWLRELDTMTEEAGYDMLRFHAAIDKALTASAVAFSAQAETTERLFQGILGVAHHALYTLSPRGDITDWNAGAEKTKGYSRQDVIGTHFERFFHHCPMMLGGGCLCP